MLYVPNVPCLSTIRSVTWVEPKTCAVQSLSSSLSLGELVSRVIRDKSDSASMACVAVAVSWKYIHTRSQSTLLEITLCSD